MESVLPWKSFYVRRNRVRNRRWHPLVFYINMKQEGELMDPAIITLSVLAVAAFLFITELIPLAVTAMAACTALGILGVLPSKAV